MTANTWMATDETIGNDIRECQKKWKNVKEKKPHHKKEPKKFLLDGAGYKTHGHNHRVTNM